MTKAFGQPPAVSGIDSLTCHRPFRIESLLGTVCALAAISLAAPSLAPAVTLTWSTSNVVVCPGGDGTYLTVSGITPGATVEATFDASACYWEVFCAPHRHAEVFVYTVTDWDGDGVVQIRPMAGGIGCCDVTTEVVVDGGPPLSRTDEWRSYDLSTDDDPLTNRGDCWVGSADETYFTSVYLTNDCAADFNDDGQVTIVDLNLFSFHWHHGVQPQTYEDPITCVTPPTPPCEATAEAGRFRISLEWDSPAVAPLFRCRETGNGAAIHNMMWHLVPALPPIQYELSIDDQGYALAESVYVCMTYEQDWPTGDESDLQLMRYDPVSGYDPLRSISVDPVNNEICGWTDYFGSMLPVARNDDPVFVLVEPTPAATGVPEVGAASEISVPAAYPNPFDPATTVRFQVPAQTSTLVRVYDVRGRQVATLADGERGAGWHEVPWNGTDQSGELLPAGVYFIRVDVGSEVTTTKVVLRR